MTTTHTDPTGAALLRAILLRPADDTARLVFADWLDEHGEHERAEFIRAQVFGRGLLGTAQACPHCVDGARLGDVGTGAPPRCAECCGTGSRYGREWGGIPCPVCAPPNPEILGWNCELCGGLNKRNTGFAPTDVRRGFVFRVRCRMGDVLREVEVTCPECGGDGSVREPVDCTPCSGEGTLRDWALTPWAAGVLAAHPVTEWEIVDREPAQLGTRYGWWENGADEPHIIGRVLWPEMYEPGGVRREWDDSPELARDALAQAVGRVARRLAGLPEVTP